ncbi:hypothetical protein ACX93W_26745 [Paenibacillus sp. CAU 1782]
MLHFQNLLEIEKGKKLTLTHYEMFKRRPIETLDQLDMAYHDLLHFLLNYEYYDTIDRIEKGEALYAAETDPIKRKRYKARLDELKAKLETLTLKGDAA